MKCILALFLFANSLLIGQEYRIVDDEKSGKAMLVGTTQREAFQDSNFAWWFNSEYNSYDVDTGLVANFLTDCTNINIKLVLGTWCSDSRREVPKVLKILDFVDFPDDSLTLVNIDRRKKALTNEVEGLNIELVPTIIVYENDKEIGRIIETPEGTLEEDLVKIVTDYK